MNQKKSRNTLSFIALCIGSIIIFAITLIFFSNKSRLYTTPDQSIQQINQEQTNNDITMKIEYVVVDQKQIIIFYTLQSEKYLNLRIDPKISNVDGSELGSFSTYTGASNTNSNEPQIIIITFSDTNTPESLNLECKAFNSGTTEQSTPIADDLKTTPESKLPDSTAKFNFTLEFDPKFLNQSEILTINKDFTIEGQNFEITTAEIYPSQMRINIKEDENNTALISSLKFYLKNEEGKLFESGYQGVQSSGHSNSPLIKTYYLDSPFYYNHKSLDMYITDIVWLNKDEKRIKVDIKNVTADKLPEGVELLDCVKTGNDLELSFIAPTLNENVNYMLFQGTYYDEFGKEYYDYGSSSGNYSYFDEKTQKYIEDKCMFKDTIYLRDYPYDVIYLSPAYSNRVKLETPLEIKLN